MEKLRQLIEEEVHILESSIVDQVNGKNKRNLPPIIFLTSTTCIEEYKYKNEKVSVIKYKQ